MEILFIFEIVCLVALCVTAFLKKYSKRLGAVRIALLLATVLSGVAVFVLDTAFSSVAIGVSVGAVISFLLYIFSVSKGNNVELKNTAVFMSKAILVILILEALVFNFNSFHVMGGSYEEFSLSVYESEHKNLTQTDSDTYTVTDADSPVSLEFLDINKEIGTIYFDVESESAKVEYNIDFADESNSSYYIRSSLVQGEIYPDIEDSKYVICNFSGDVDKLRISLTADEKPLTISDTVKFNLDHPTTFSLLRILVFLLISVFVYLLLKSEYLSRTVKEQKSGIKTVTAITVLILVFVMMFITAMASRGQDIFHLQTGNQMTKELVDAFKNGQVTLIAKPDDELLNLENPYDWSQRLENDVTALWDHVFYDGEYYSYYGIGPVLLLFLPYNLLTGYYFPSTLATFIFSAVGLIFLGLTFMKLCKRYFYDIPLSMYLMSLVMLLSSSGIWYCLFPSNFYEIAQSSGFCFVTLGAYFLVSANVFDKGKISLIKLGLSSLFLSIAVTCRPTTAIWCVVALLFIGTGLVKIYRQKKSDEKTVSYVKYLVYALLPFAVIGAMQMIYNYIRFDSFTDFGIQYSLTINDFLSAQYHTQFAAIGFYNYLFAPPSFESAFPFVVTNITDLDVNGYYFTATNNGVGLFFRALPSLALFFSPFAIKYLKKENKAIVITLFTAVAVVAPFIIIFSIWESGYGVRYMVDFAWQMLTCAFFVIFMFYRNTKAEETKRVYRYAMVVMMLCCIVVNFALTYSYISMNATSHSTVVMLEEVARAFSIFRT